ncbi:MAG: divalent metal cation transporter [Candidatus Nanopelagicales bacterium]|nr:divalent metal cation transporter [Candidatus Nanopelagicales bacterium]
MSKLPESEKTKHHPARLNIRSAGYFSRIGPGIVTGAADDDPSGIGTYSQTGAQFGYRFLWAAPFLLPFAFAIQETCARLALVTGHGLARIIKRRFPNSVLLLTVALVALANTVNIAADLGSMAAVVGMFVPLPQLVGVVLIALLIGFVEIIIPYHQYTKVLRWLCLSLLTYVAVLAVANVNWNLAWYSLTHIDIEFSKLHIAAIIAIAGTTISPYLFFWQAAEEMEVSGGSPDTSQTHIKAMRGDVFAGMFSGVFVMFAIMTTTAATLNIEGITQISSPEQAAMALEPIAGQAAGALFALGILGTGLLAVPVLAGSTAYAVSEALGWRESLERKPSQAKQFYAVIAVSMLIAVALNFLGINPMRSLVVAALLNGLTAPVLMFIIWWLARDKQLLGEWVSPWWSNLLVGAGAVMMAALPVLWLFAPI